MNEKKQQQIARCCIKTILNGEKGKNGCTLKLQVDKHINDLCNTQDSLRGFISKENTEHNCIYVLGLDKLADMFLIKIKMMIQVSNISSKNSIPDLRRVA